MFTQDSVRTPDGLPLGFPIQVDSANRCYRNVNQSPPSCRRLREEFFNKTGPFCEDRKTTNFLWPLPLQITVQGKRGQRQQRSHLTGSFLKGTDPCQHQVRARPGLPGQTHTRSLPSEEHEVTGKKTASTVLGLPQLVSCKPAQGCAHAHAHAQTPTSFFTLKLLKHFSSTLSQYDFSSQRLLSCFSFKQILFTYKNLHYFQGPRPNPTSCLLPHPPRVCHSRDSWTP